MCYRARGWTTAGFQLWIQGKHYLFRNCSHFYGSKGSKVLGQLAEQFHEQVRPHYFINEADTELRCRRLFRQRNTTATKILPQKRPNKQPTFWCQTKCWATSRGREDYERQLKQIITKVFHWWRKTEWRPLLRRLGLGKYLHRVLTPCTAPLSLCVACKLAVRPGIQFGSFSASRWRYNHT